jgi:hypothetical protein
MTESMGLGMLIADGQHASLLWPGQDNVLHVANNSDPATAHLIALSWSRTSLGARSSVRAQAAMASRRDTINWKGEVCPFRRRAALSCGGQ